MFEYMTEREVESKIQPGVKYQIKEVCNEVRDSIMMETADLRAETQRILMDAAELQDQGKELSKDSGAKEYSDALIKAEELQIKMQASQRKASQIHARAMLAGVEGMTMNGKPVEVDFFIRRGPEPLLNELNGILSEMLGLSPDERKNSQSPTISPVPEGGATNDSTVEAAA